jgi:glycerophosphoryl diester phosphodiesterase
MNRTLNIAHRGFSGIYPENTMLSFEKAVEAQCDGIENDVQLTKDGIAVICHDELVDRTTDGRGLISEYTYRDLCKLDAGIKWGKRYKGMRIPTLDEFMDYVKDKDLFINIELKTGIIPYKGIEELVIGKIHQYKLQDKVILSSFNHYSMVLCKQIDSGIRTGLLYEALLYHPEKYAEYVGADALHPSFYSVLDEHVAGDIKKKGFSINTYTVNEERYMKRLIELGIDGIITNYPDKLKKVLQEVQ